MPGVLANLGMGLGLDQKEFTTAGAVLVPVGAVMTTLGLVWALRNRTEVEIR